jgi:hypothetical protein
LRFSAIWKYSGMGLLRSSGRSVMAPLQHRAGLS